MTIFADHAAIEAAHKKNYRDVMYRSKDAKGEDPWWVLSTTHIFDWDDYEYKIVGASGAVHESERKARIMLAHAQGATIEVQVQGTWQPASAPCWNWDMYDYRVKPEPRTFYFVHGSSLCFTTLEQAQAAYPNGTIFKGTEVL